MLTVSVQPRGHDETRQGAEVYIEADGQRFKIGTAWERPESNEIRFTLSTELEEITEAKYTNVPAIDLALVPA